MSITKRQVLVVVEAGLKYLWSAGAGLALDWLVFWTSWSLFGFLGIEESNRTIAAQVLARTAGAFMAFYMFRNVAFKDADGDVRQHAKRFVLAAVASWVMSISLVSALSYAYPIAFNIMLVGALHDWAIGHITLAVKFTSDGITFVTNYAVMRFWVFQPQRKD